MLNQVQIESLQTFYSLVVTSLHLKRGEKMCESDGGSWFHSKRSSYDLLARTPTSTLLYLRHKSMIKKKEALHNSDRTTKCAGAEAIIIENLKFEGDLWVMTTWNHFVWKLFQGICLSLGGVFSKPTGYSADQHLCLSSVVFVFFSLLCY